ncbi:MAG: ATP-binding protein [Chlamydiota bacterium]
MKDILRKKDNQFNVSFLTQCIEDFERLGFKIKNDNKNIDDITNNEYGNFCLNDKQITDPSTIVAENGYFNAVIKSEGLDAFRKILFKILTRYYFEILNGYIKQEYIGPLIARLKKQFDILDKIFTVEKSETEEKRIAVINLKNADLEIKKVAPLLICKTHYHKQKSNPDQSLHIIVDEAHNILSETSARESESWKDYRLETFEEIIKEGRKFGVFLTIASQRPSDISPTIISQLHNYFIHKLLNDNDLKAISKVVSYLDKPSFDSISNLSVGCCFIAGQMTQFPLSLKVELLGENERPQSETIDLNTLWSNNKADQSR